MQLISGLSTITNPYEAFILDLWGVIHDGSQLYPGVHDTLAQLRSSGKKILMLSNAPRRAWKVEKVLNELGIEKELYDGVISSGEAGYQWLSSLFHRERDGVSRGEGYPVFKSPHLDPLPEGEEMWRRYYYIGPGKDLDVMDGLNLEQVDNLEEANFLLNVGFGSDEQTADDWTSHLDEAQSLGLTMLCLNPDLEVVKITGEHYPCAGVLARSYESMGGKVLWFGKPYPAVYEYCRKKLAPLPKSAMLAIGDSIDTDITGAVHFGIDSALVTGGILKDKTSQEIEELCQKRGVTPNYILPRLVS